MDRQELLNKRVVVICGGWSDERDISMLSANECHDALLEAGFGTVDVLDLASRDFVPRLVSGGYDVAFVAMHGAYGEDGCVQGLLEVLHMPYTFSGVAASAVASEKQLSKAVYEAAKIRAPRGVDLSAGTVLTDDQVDSLVGELGLPLFVKPAANGSSYGVSFVHGADELLPAIERAAEHGGKVLVEQRLVGTEITVGVYDAPDWLRALPVVEIRKQENAEFYDLNVKYIDPSQVHRIPAQIAPEDYARAQELACRAHEALGCTGFSRSDFIVTENGPVILETNTIPGMTDTSLYPDEVRHAGMAFSDVCARLVELALDGALAHHLDDAEVPADLAESMYPQLWGRK